MIGEFIDAEQKVVHGLAVLNRCESYDDNAIEFLPDLS
jgi:hypothetical protein